MSIKLSTLSSAILLIACVVATPGHAADEKITSSAICQAMTPTGAQHLTHLGSSLQAVGTDVTVICPIVRDNLNGKMQSIEVRHLRPGHPSGQVTGSVYSCDSVFGGCSQISQSTAGSNEYTSIFINTTTLPSSNRHYFYYRSVLPQNWKIVSIKQRED